MSEFHVGDRVRVIYEGKVTRTKSDAYVSVKTDDGNTYYLLGCDIVTVIEPAYEKGQLYRDSRDDVFRYNGDDWTIIYTRDHNLHVGAIGHFCGNDVPVRPLRKLVPEA